MSTRPTSRAGSPQFSARIGPCALTASMLRTGARELSFTSVRGTQARPSVSACRRTVALDGETVDVEISAAAAVDSVIDILGSTNRGPEMIRVRGELDEFGDWSLQCGADIVAGRILVGAGKRPWTLQAWLRRRRSGAGSLPHHVVRRDAPPLRMPVMQSNRLASSGFVRDAADVQESQAVSMQVEGVGTSFVLYFNVGGLLAIAGATCESGALLLDKYAIEQNRSAGEGEGRRAAHFTFVTRGLGVHHVRVDVADAALG
ncbi:hypothetical protein EV121DRAFT_270986 [Schizophyllum commune]